VGETLFVGRAKEIARTSQLLDDVAAGHGRLLLLVGEPGIGKTRLAQWVERAASARGFRLGWGRCWEAGGAPAFWPWSQVFDALGVPDPLAATAGGALESRDLRFQQFEGARRLLSTVAAEAPTVVILDDLHAADVPSLNLLHVLARGLRSGRILIVGTYRDAEARIGETGALLARIAREGEVVALSRLDCEDVTAWVRAASPGTADAVGDQVHALTEGNPLFVHELLRVGKLKALDARRLPEGLRAVLDEHLALVSPEARALLVIATVFGREVSVQDVAGVAGTNADDVAGRFREACDAGLLEPAASDPDRYAFAHALLRDRLYADLAPSERATLHWRAGERLASRGEVANGAHHLLVGSSAGNATRAAEVAREAASNAMSRLGFEDTVDLATRALAALEAAGVATGALACELEILRAEARIRLGETEAGKADCVRAALLARSVGSPALQARAALAYGTEIASAEIDPTMVGILRDALQSLESSSEDAARARVMARLAAALNPPRIEHLQEMLRLVRDSLSLARRLGDPETLLYASFFAIAALPYHDVREVNFAVIRDVIELSTTLDRPLVFLQAGGWWIANLRELGMRKEADAALAKYERLAKELPRPHHKWRLPLLRATALILDGDLEGAERLGLESLAIAESANVALGLLAWGLHRVGLALARDEPASILPDAERLLQAFAGKPALGIFSAWVLAVIGRKAEALALVDGLDFANYPKALVVAEVAVLLKDEALGARVLDGLASNVRLNVVFWGAPAGVTVIGPASRLRGNLAALLGREEEARRHYEEAVATARQIGAVPHEALARRALERLGAREAHGAASQAERRMPFASTLPSAFPASHEASIAFARKGATWTVTSFTGVSVRLKASKGLRYLERLVTAEGKELHAMDLCEMEEPPGDAGSVLDAKAKNAYRARLASLREQLDEATSFADVGRAERAREEIDALTGELARAVGLGGRDRKAGAFSERARINVQRRIRLVIEQIAEQDEVLARCLTLSIRTGVFCVFRRPL
jgi:tetratricopeptide (TPR) repeat protein